MYTHFSVIPDGAALLTVAASLAPEAHITIAIPAMATTIVFTVLRENDLNMEYVPPFVSLPAASIIGHLARRQEQCCTGRMRDQ
jgi:hypothetical protein